LVSRTKRLGGSTQTLGWLDQTIDPRDQTFWRGYPIVWSSGPIVCSPGLSSPSLNREAGVEGTGFTRFTYNDTALTVKKEIKVDSSGNLGTMIVHYDGLYREIQKETYDPEGTIYVDSQYDAKGRKWKVSNPRRSAETAVWTQFSYDTLDRPKITTAPDGSTITAAIKPR
jgi:hypothetical protein